MLFLLSQWSFNYVTSLKHACADSPGCPEKSYVYDLNVLYQGGYYTSILTQEDQATKIGKNSSGLRLTGTTLKLNNFHYPV